jgi:hypothetical protein
VNRTPLFAGTELSQIPSKSFYVVTVNMEWVKAQLDCSPKTTPTNSCCVHPMATPTHWRCTMNGSHIYSYFLLFLSKAGNAFAPNYQFLFLTTFRRKILDVSKLVFHSPNENLT